MEPISSGDFGYDEVHDEVGRRPAPGERPVEHPGPKPATRRIELDQDMSYDEAHDF
jgi:hypothetical protein